MQFYVVVKENAIIEIGLKGLELGTIIPELTNYTDIERLDLSGSEFDEFPMDLEN